MTMVQRSYTVRFLTPAFLGDANQSGCWRTPPFKHLLREWWRVAWASANHVPADAKAVERLRKEEGDLFGSAAGNSGNRSRVLLRLDKWEKGRMEEWEADPSVIHSEIGDGGKQIGAHLYLGYGPLDYDRQRKNTVLKRNAAIQAGESAELRLALPDRVVPLLDQTLGLVHCFGTLGGRSRNGWGSLALEGAPELASLPLRNWRECIKCDWPHAIGRDEKGALIWQTEPFLDWKELMQRLAEIKIELRTQFKFHTGKKAPMPEERHWLAYPVTNHSVERWGQKRLPNSLRFKVVPDENGSLRGLIFHVPLLPPSGFSPDRGAIERVWQQVHGHLDAAESLKRVQS